MSMDLYLKVKIYHQKGWIDLIAPAERRDCEFQNVVPMYPSATVMSVTGNNQSRIQYV